VALLFALLLTSWHSSVQAEDKLPFKPGLWEMVMQIDSAATGPSSHTTKECITEEVMDSEKMAKNMEESMPNIECEVDKMVDGASMTITLSCDGDGGKVSGKGDYKTEDDGETMTGEMVMDMQIQGMSMKMSMKADGKRVGDC